MPKHIRRKSQAKNDRRAVKKLRELGIIKKADLRRAPTAAQKRTIKKYSDVLTGRAKVVRPKNPSTYKKLFRVAGKNVIVPKRKGEKISINRAGEIVRKRKVAGRKRTGTFKHVPRIQDRKHPPKRAGVLYGLPLTARGGGTEWHWFSSWQKLLDFINETSPKSGKSLAETYPNWSEYVIEEELDADEMSADEETRAEIFDKALTKKLQRRQVQREFTRKFPPAGIDPFTRKK